MTRTSSDKEGVRDEEKSVAKEKKASDATRPDSAALQIEARSAF